MKPYICIVCHGVRVPEEYKRSSRLWRHASRAQGVLCWWIRMLSGFPDKSVIAQRPTQPKLFTSFPVEETARPTISGPSVWWELGDKTVDDFIADLEKKFYIPIQWGTLQGA